MLGKLLLKKVTAKTVRENCSALFAELAYIIVRGNSLAEMTTNTQCFMPLIYPHFFLFLHAISSENLDCLLVLRTS